MSERLTVHMEPVEENQEAVVELLTESLGLDSQSEAVEFVEEGGVAVTGYNRQTANAIKDRLTVLRVETAILPMDELDEEESSDALVGRVRGIRSGLPVEGAAVTIRAVTEGTRLGRATSDGDGRFRLPEFGPRIRGHASLTRPQLEVTVTQSGETVESRHKPFDWEVFATEDYVFDIAAAPPDANSSSGSADETVYRVRGQVTSSDGSPVEAMTVRAFDRDLRSDAISFLSERLEGDLVLPDAVEYDETRQFWNGPESEPTVRSTSTTTTAEAATQHRITDYGGC
jgi:hypothetical protein